MSEVVYKIVNPKGRVYIGQTTNLKKRVSQYGRLTNKTQSRLYNSFKKYGFKAHEISVLEECKVEDLNIRERFWQEHYEVLTKVGLNCRMTATTDKSGYLSEETKRKMSKAQKGKSIPEETRRKISNTLKGNTPVNKGTKGLYKQSKESNRKRSETGKTSSTTAKAVEQYTKEGKFIKNWDSARQAGVGIGKRSGSAILECCSNKRKSIYGFNWKFKKEESCRV